jgi:hypothetical protein
MSTSQFGAKRLALRTSWPSSLSSDGGRGLPSRKGSSPGVAMNHGGLDLRDLEGFCDIQVNSMVTP